MTESSWQAHSAAQLPSALSQQSIVLGHHEAALQAMTQQQTTLLQSVNNLTKLFHDLSSRIPILNAQDDPPTCVSDSTDPPVSPAFWEEVYPAPEPFSRELGESKGFLLQCAFVFE